MYTHPILSQWWQVIHLTEVRLSLLYCLHAAVYGTHKRLLRQALMTHTRYKRQGYAHALHLTVKSKVCVCMWSYNRGYTA